MSSCRTEVEKRVSAMMEGGTKAAQYSDYYKNNEIVNRNDYSGRFNPNLTNKSSFGSISKGNINIGSLSSMSRTGPNLSGYGIY